MKKCKNLAGHEGKPGLQAWPKSQAPALTWAGLPGLNKKPRKYTMFFLTSVLLFLDDQQLSIMQKNVILFKKPRITATESRLY